MLSTNSCIILMSFIICVIAVFVSLVCISNRNVIRNLTLPLFFEKEALLITEQFGDCYMLV